VTDPTRVPVRPPAAEPARLIVAAGLIRCRVVWWIAVSGEFAARQLTHGRIGAPADPHHQD
jgi:hypothetical protein